jgi:oxygen-independent coproporphyrinogen-3 oxidase
VRSVIREIEISGLHHEPETIFFGGGTPSLLEGPLVEAILRALPGAGSTAVEMSLEANPGTLPLENLAAYRGLGVNRISLGVQSFDARDLQVAGRLHKVSDTISDFESLRRFGFANINIDLIAGLPGQTPRVWSENLDWLERLRPEHVSIYMLDAEEHSMWGKRSIQGPTEEEHARFYLDAAERLEKLGYIHYEISNWALPGRECVHNLKY